MTARMDVSAVAHQGGYIAKMCPVVIQNRVLVPHLEVRERAPDVQMRIDQGVEFECQLVDKHQDSGWYVISDVREEMVAAAVRAMEESTPVIFGGWLPDDEVGRRTGRPDLLVFAGDGYVPVDIKWHKTLDPDENNSAPVSDPWSPSPASSYELAGWKVRASKDDLLQLAHYRVMLQACGMASASSLGGIIGKEELVVWYDLDLPRFVTPSTSDPNKKTKARTAMEVYYFEFGFRLDVAATALEYKRKGGGELIVEPMWSGECSSCGFHDHCVPILTEGPGDASLIPNNQYQQWRAMRNNGVRTREDVARLHYPTASLAREVELLALFEAAGSCDPSTPVRSLRPRAVKQMEILEAAGIHTVADLDTLDPLTARLGGFVAQKILDARAALGDAPAYRRPGCNGRDIPRADIEIDVDMENMNEGVYLWGTYLTDRVGSGRFETGYRAFTTWEPLDAATEQQPLIEVLAWLNQQRALAAGLGLSLRAYVWHEGAENPQIQRIAKAAGILDVANELIESDAWVDLKKVFEASWLTGGSRSLKAVAPLAGYSWPVDDPGGGMAMVKYREAVEAGSAEARQWLFDYNRGDVEATLAIREWLDQNGASWPEVATD